MKKSILLLALFLPYLALAQADRERNSENELLEINLAEPQTPLLIERSINIDWQTRRPVRTAEPVEMVFAPGMLRFDQPTSFIAFSAAWEETDPDPDNTQLFLSTSSDGTNWSPWLPIPRDAHAVEVRYSFSSELIFLDRSVRHYRVKMVGNLQKHGVLAHKLLLNFFSPGEPVAPTTVAPQETSAAFPSDCPCLLPEFTTRQGWNCPQGITFPAFTRVTHLIVHHSATANVSNDWPGVVLSFWNFHVNTNGWSDIGYNWLIDPNGKLYEGRGGGDNVIGAHFCGRNSGTMGVCMIGTYTSTQATEAAQKTLVDLLAWKACKEDISPVETALHAGTGFNLHRISGHRDGCSTECPGELLYGRLPALRTAVRDKIAACNLATQVAQIPGLEYLRITPNPVNNLLTARIELSLRQPTAVRYRIFDSSGKLIAQSRVMRLQGAQQLELPELTGVPPGAYSIQCWIDRQVLTQRLIKL